MRKTIPNLNHTILLSILCLILSKGISAQDQVLDKIIAKVGTQIIKASDVEAQYYELKAQDEKLPDSTRCELFESLLLQSIFVEKGKRDSVDVTDEEVESTLDNRMRYFIYQYGSEENLMRITGKSLQQMKDDFRTKIKDQLMAQRVQQEIISTVKVSPREVKVFFDDIPPDSLPQYGAQVEVSQLVLVPKASDEVEQYTLEKMQNLRKEIVEEGKSFDIMAGIYSEDPGSKNKGGELGFISQDQVVPAFAENVFKLEDGEISPVFRSRYGYHIAQMMKREGDKAKVRHILMHPAVTSADVQVYLDSLEDIKAKLDSGDLTFQKAVGIYTEDDQGKMSGGFILDQQGNSMIDLDMLDPQALSVIDTMKVGEISEPMVFSDPTSGDKEVRIIYLKNKTKPHVANLNEDYDRIQSLALHKKQYEYMNTWVRENINDYYVEIENDYPQCSNISLIRSYIITN